MTVSKAKNRIASALSARPAHTVVFAAGAVCVADSIAFLLIINDRAYAAGVRGRHRVPSGCGYPATPEYLRFRLCGANSSPHTGEKRVSWRDCVSPNLLAGDDCVIRVHDSI